MSSPTICPLSWGRDSRSRTRTVYGNCSIVPACSYDPPNGLGARRHERLIVSTTRASPCASGQDHLEHKHLFFTYSRGVQKRAVRCCTRYDSRHRTARPPLVAAGKMRGYTKSASKTGASQVVINCRRLAILRYKYSQQLASYHVHQRHSLGTSRMPPSRRI